MYHVWIENHVDRNKAPLCIHLIKTVLQITANRAVASSHLRVTRQNLNVAVAQ